MLQYRQDTKEVYRSDKEAEGEGSRECSACHIYRHGTHGQSMFLMRYSFFLRQTIFELYNNNEIFIIPPI